MECRVCGNKEANIRYQAREMMMGLRESFSYFQCGKCKCLQIEDIPGDMAPFYSHDYYSFQDEESDRYFVRKIKQIRNKYAVFSHPFWAKLFYHRYPELNLRSLSYLDLHKEMRILDVGCGTGNLLQALDQLGFKHLTGIDPYNKEEIINIGEHTKIYKKKLDELNKQRDLIMMHHVFEHMPDPLKVLKKCSRLLSQGGICLIRIPIVESKAWGEYREHWVQLDPPRHFFIHSPRSMQYLTEKTDFEIEDIIYDSTAFQFWGSEQYMNDIPLQDERSYAVNPDQSMFTREQIESFSKRAEQLNKDEGGDQAIFILKKT